MVAKICETVQFVSQEVLDDRLNKRVDSMVEQGLIEELLQFHKNYNEHRLQSGRYAITSNSD